MIPISEVRQRGCQHLSLQASPRIATAPAGTSFTQRRTQITCASKCAALRARLPAGAVKDARRFASFGTVVTFGIWAVETGTLTTLTVILL
jgi:hypothetical protein